VGYRFRRNRRSIQLKSHWFSEELEESPMREATPIKPIMKTNCYLDVISYSLIVESVYIFDGLLVGLCRVTFDWRELVWWLCRCPE
jgi:hypothetical protein